MAVFAPVAEQMALIQRGVEKIVPEEELAARLERSRQTGRPLRIKYGIDPTGIDVHLGHTVPLRKMRQFQELGHQVVIIIGNATALVGDPSGRDQARAKRLTPEEIETNARDYLEQVGKVVDLSKAEIHRNGQWFSEMGLGEILQLCARVTVAQLLTRDDFAKRYAAASPIYLHECLYPLMQAFDSVCIASDIELGGTEQLYSFMLARDLQKDPATCELAARWMSESAKQHRLPDGSLPQQIGVMSPILVGLDGVRRMGKSLGNYIGISEPPYEMIKKFMQLPDEVMSMYFELLTDLEKSQAEELIKSAPQDAKFELGRRVIDSFHPGEGTTAVERWKTEIRGKQLPKDIPEVTISPGDSLTPGEGQTWTRMANGHPQELAYILLWKAGLVATKGEARKLIAQGGGYVDESRERITSYDQLIDLTPGRLVWAGSKKVARIQPAG